MITKIELKWHRYTGAKILINGKYLTNEKYFNIGKELYAKALDKLDKEVQVMYENTYNSPYNSFYWCLSYDIKRDDGIKNTVLDYLIIELVNYYTKFGRVEINFNYYPGKSLLRYLNTFENIFVKMRSSNFQKLRLKVRYLFGPIPVLLRYFSIIFTGKTNLLKKSGSRRNILLTNLDLTQNRWKNYPELIKEQSKDSYFLDVDLKRLQSFNGKMHLNIKLFSLSNFLKALFHTFRMHTRRKKDYGGIFNLYFTKVVDRQSFLQSLCVFWRFEAFKILFLHYKVSDIHVLTSFGDPFKRLPLSVAKETGRTGHLVACRPFLSIYRSEDRIIQADLDNSKITGLPDDIFVLDHFSKTTVSKFGRESKVLCGSKNEGITIISNGYLLLFSDEEYNNELINLISLLKEFFSTNRVSIFYREHPRVQLNEFQKQRLDLLEVEIISLNDYIWNELKFKRVLTFSSNTTSGIEAYQRGCDLLWLPFLSVNFLQFAGYADAYGKTATSSAEFLKFCKNYLSNDIK